MVLKKSYLNEFNFVKQLLKEDFFIIDLVIIPVRDLIFVYLMPDKKRIIVKGDLSKLMELIENNFSVIDMEEDELKIIYKIAKK